LMRNVFPKLIIFTHGCTVILGYYELRLLKLRTTTFNKKDCRLLLRKMIFIDLF
jgi:hypothetical protein